MGSGSGGNRAMGAVYSGWSHLKCREHVGNVAGGSGVVVVGSRERWKICPINQQAVDPSHNQVRQIPKIDMCRACQNVSPFVKSASPQIHLPPIKFIWACHLVYPLRWQSRSYSPGGLPV